VYKRVIGVCCVRKSSDIQQNGQDLRRAAAQGPLDPPHRKAIPPRPTGVLDDVALLCQRKLYHTDCEVSIDPKCAALGAQ
jgi:hypothetical protein